MMSKSPPTPILPPPGSVFEGWSGRFANGATSARRRGSANWRAKYARLRHYARQPLGRISLRPGRAGKAADWLLRSIPPWAKTAKRVDLSRNFRSSFQKCGNEGIKQRALTSKSVPRSARHRNKRTPRESSRYVTTHGGEFKLSP